MKKSFFTFVGLALVLLSAGSCQKELPVYSFRIVVVNEDGIRIQNALVRATAPVVNAIPDFNDTTNVFGETGIHTYPYEAVLQVKASKGGNPPLVEGCGFVKLIADSVVELKVVVLPYSGGASGC
jgi:hypothetical protein